MLRGLERFTSFRFNPICPNSALAARYFFDNGGFTWYFSALSSNRSLVGFFDAQVNADLVGQSFRKLSMGLPVCTENPIRVDDLMESPKLAE